MGLDREVEEGSAPGYSAIFQHDFAINSEKNDEQNGRMWLPF